MDHAWLVPVITAVLSLIGVGVGAFLGNEYFWSRQKRWELKREILFQASKNFAEVDELMIWFHSMMRNPQDPNRADDGVAKLVDRWNRASAGLYETKNLADIVCEFATREAFLTLAAAANDYEQAVEKRDALLYEQTFKNLRSALTAAKTAVRKELGIDDAGKGVDTGRV